MEIKDLFYHSQWERRPEESDDDYDIRILEQEECFKKDLFEFGPIIIVNPGYPLKECVPLLIRLNKYIQAPDAYRRKIQDKCIDDLKYMYSWTNPEKRIESVNTPAGKISILVEKRQKYIEGIIRNKTAEINHCKCALCQDTGWVGVFYPLFFKQGYYRNGFVDLGGHTDKCSGCPKIEKPQKTYKRSLTGDND